MKPLTQYRRGDHDYCIIERFGDVAIFQCEPPNRKPMFEVIKIQTNKEREMFGKMIAASESCPCANLWGQRGWTFTSMEDARAKFKSLASLT